MKTDLTRILAISGQSGLFLYVSQARNGAIVEALADKKRTSVGVTSKITSLADISIYTDDEEVKLQDVFVSMKGFSEMLMHHLQRLHQRSSRLFSRRHSLLMTVTVSMCHT